MAILPQRDLAVVERVAAAVEIHAVLAEEWIYGEQAVRAECVLVTGRKAEGCGTLLLVLIQLVVCVRDLEPVACAEDVEVKCIDARRLPVNTIKNCGVCTFIVKRSKFRRIEESPGANRIDH